MSQKFRKSTATDKNGKLLKLLRGVGNFDKYTSMVFWNRYVLSGVQQQYETNTCGRSQNTTYTRFLAAAEMSRSSSKLVKTGTTLTLYWLLDRYIINDVLYINCKSDYNTS